MAINVKRIGHVGFLVSDFTAEIAECAEKSQPNYSILCGLRVLCGEILTSQAKSRLLAGVSLHCFGILRPGELLTVGDLHTIAEDLQPVAVWVQEVERAAATAACASAGESDSALKTRTGSGMFLTCCSPRSSKATGSLFLTSS